MRSPAIVAVVLALAAPAGAQDGGVEASVGYAFSQYLEEGGGNAPLGLYVSLASKKRVGFDVDLAYHRDSEELFGETFTLHTVIGGVGPRWRFESGNTRPFLHVLGGLRYDTAEGESNTALGGMAGGGVDISAGSVSVRLGADFQMFFDEGDNLKTLRVTAGITF